MPARPGRRGALVGAGAIHRGLRPRYLVNRTVAVNRLTASRPAMTFPMTATMEDSSENG